jgi:Gpi18-like mannosyltransferase
VRVYSKWLPWFPVPIFVLAGIGLRFAGMKFVSLDMRIFLLSWYDQLATNGFAALREPFSNYTPPYLYLLFLATKMAGSIPAITAIKLLSVCFDFLNAFLVYQILKFRFPQGTMSLTGASLFLLLPTVLVNSAYWGQSDSIYTFFLLACLLFLMKQRPRPAMILLGISFSFKAQAAFLAPLLFLLILKKKIPWFYLAIIPAVYILLVIPAALTGRPFSELLTIYASQEQTYSGLSMHAPNLYLLFPANLHNPALVLFGIMATMIAALAWTSAYLDKIHTFTPQAVLLFGLMSVALMPFFLPKMHERYFYLADVISFLVAFYFPRGWLLALGYQLTSGLSYSVFLIESVTRITHRLAVDLLMPALMINIALLGFIFSYPWKLGDNRAYENYD